MVLTLLLALLIPSVAANAATPDFAFPAKVEKNAKADYASAMSRKDYPRAMRALMDASLARGQVEAAKVNEAITAIGEFREKVKADPVATAMADALLAAVYYDIYADNAWTYNSRSLPDDPLPDDFTQWSGRQFYNTIIGLSTQALTRSAELQAMPLSVYGAVVETDRYTSLFYPTVYDFLAVRLIDYYNVMWQAAPPSSSFMPLDFLGSYPQVRSVSMAFIGDTSRDILNTYYSLLEFHRDDTPAYIAYDLRRIAWVRGRARASNGYENGDSVDAVAFDTYRHLFRRFATSEYSGLVLEAAYDNGMGSDTRCLTWIYDHCRDNLRKFPAAFNNGCLQRIIDDLGFSRVTVSYPEVAAVNHPTPVKISGDNVNRLTLKVYRVPVEPSRTSVRVSDAMAGGSLVTTHEVDMAGVVPFKADTVFNIQLTAPGDYVVIPVFDGCVANDREYVGVVRCTSLYAGHVNFDKPQVLVVDNVSGEPVADARLLFYNNRGVAINAGKASVTDASGLAPYDMTNPLTVVARKGDAYSLPQYASPYGGYELEKTRRGMSIYTSLPIYHQGDTLQWAAVAFKATRFTGCPLSAASVKMTLRDANYQIVDTATVVTDDYGRCSGRFVLPADRLTGEYRLDGECEGYSSSAHVTVSDYKLPTFEVVTDKALHDYPSAGDVTVKGRAVTYAGFPVSDASVSMTLNVARPWFRWGGGQPVEFFSAIDVTTGSDGSFSFTLPDALLRQSPIVNGIYSARITVVSPSGEACEATADFSRESSGNLVASVEGNLNVSAPVRLNVKVLDNEGNPVDTEVSYQLVSDDANAAVAARGSFMSDNPVVDWSGVPAATYLLRLKTATDSVTAGPVCVYRPGDKYSPSNSLLWTPDENMTINDEGSVPVPLGTTARVSHVLVSVNDGADYLRQHWIRLDRGMHSVKVDIPDHVKRATVTFYTVNDLAAKRVNVVVTRREVLRTIKIKTTSFRDRIVPGDRETWTLDIVTDSGSPAAAAVMLDMYNKALDRLAPLRWRMDVYRPGVRYFDIGVNGVDGNVFVSRSQKSVRRGLPECVTVGEPRFSTYGMSFYPSAAYGYGRMYYTRATAKSVQVRGVGAVNMMADYADAVDEHAEEVAVTEADAGMAAPVAADTAGTEGVGAPSAGNTEFSYRPSEIPLAFFEPMLVAGEDGRLTYTFTVPNANTTWKFNAIAYTTDMLVAGMTEDAVSSKPVMVQPNLPRFLRVGDDAVIKAVVMNNTDSAFTVESVVELFNPADNRIIATHRFSTYLDAMSSVTLSVNTGVIGECAMIGYRVKSSTDAYSDGEQAVIPVLSTITPVIETTTFYASPSQHEIEVRLPDVKGTDDRLTLQYTANPVWTVVTALPSMRADKLSTSVAAAQSLYSAMVASSIVKDNPGIATALRRWQTSDRSDSTLVSMLSRNADLKQLMLQATPWVVDAMTDTERMERLSLLFDKNEVNRAVAAAVETLGKTVCADGGWCWSTASTSRSESSQWATNYVLTLLGELKTQGRLPAGNKRLDQMIEAALKCIDNQVAREYQRNPRSTFPDYVYMRSMFPDVRRSTAASRAYNATLQSIIAGWKDYSSPSKATAAVILERNNYHSTACHILSSLREYAIYTPASGMTWRADGAPYGTVSSTARILMAFSTVEPACSEIDPIRQWLVLQKEALNWGDNASTAMAVNAVLSTSSTWMQPAAPARFSIDGVPFEPGKAAAFTGYLRAELPVASAAGRTLTIEKGGDTPSYGAVYCRFNARMDSIAAHACDAVSVEKTLYVSRPVASGQEWAVADTLKVGDRVKVDLLIRSTRDMDYVTIVDDRAACFEPVEQLPTPLWSEGLCFYRENLDAQTRLFIDRLPRGTYRLTYELFVNNAGEYTSGIATLQSDYAPQFTAHSAGTLLRVAD